MRVFAFLLFWTGFFLSCNRASKNAPTKDFYQYYILVNLRKDDLLKIDTTYTLQYDDSSAYLHGRTEFGQYVTHSSFGHLEKWFPVSFTVLNKNYEDVLKNLNPSALQIIDSVAKIKIAIYRNTVFDSSGNIRILDSTQKGLLYHLDSIMK